LKAAALVVAPHAIVSANMTVQRQIFAAALLDDVLTPWHAVEDAENRQTANACTVKVATSWARLRCTRPSFMRPLNTADAQQPWCDDLGCCSAGDGHSFNRRTSGAGSDAAQRRQDARARGFRVLPAERTLSAGYYVNFR
jgi:hypothetical protein